MINGVSWPIGFPSSFPTPPPSSTSSSLLAASRKHAVKSFCPHPVPMANQQLQRIQATGWVIIALLLVSDIYIYWNCIGKQSWSVLMFWVFFSLFEMFLVLCAPVEMSPSSLQFHVDPFQHSDSQVSTREKLPLLPRFPILFPFSIFSTLSGFLPFFSHFFIFTSISFSPSLLSILR